MACVYTVNGTGDEFVTNVFQYVEDTPIGSRMLESIEEIILQDGLGIRVEGASHMYINPRRSQRQALKQIDSINAVAAQGFGADDLLLKTDRVGTSIKLIVDYNVLKNINKIAPDVYEFSTTANRVVEESDILGDITEEFAAMEGSGKLSQEVEKVRKNGEELTGLIIENLENNLRKLKEEPPSDQNKAQQNRIRAMLSRIKKKSESINSYYDFVHYLHDMSVKGQAQLKVLEEKYEALNTKGKVSNVERERVLRKISDLKQTIDSFYSGSSSKSIVTLLGYQVESILNSNMSDEIAAGEDILYYVRESERRMKEIDSRFLDAVLPIHVDYLLEYAPMDVNKQLDAKIERIKTAGVVVDINRFDVRYLKARAAGRDAVLALNIKQLEEKKIGREAILAEMKASHTDASWFSLWLDPVVYSRSTSIQLFANAVKTKLFGAYQDTINTKYDLADPYRKFVNWKGVGEDNPAKLYEDILETITIYRRDDETGKYSSTEVLSFVQQYDVSKFYAAKDKFYAEARARNNYPEGVKGKDLDAYFKTSDGKSYLEEVNSWWGQNTIPVEGAQSQLDALIRKKEALEFDVLTQAVPETEKAQIWAAINGLQYEIEGVFSGGVFKGNLAVPNDIYLNPKYTQMPAEAREYYDVLLDKYKTAQLKKIGGTPQFKNTWDDFSYVAPSIRKSAQDEFLEDGVSKSVKGFFQNNFLHQETDTEFGELLGKNKERLRAIPMHFVGTLDQALISRDITSSIIKFDDMANRFRSKSELHGIVNVMRSALENRMEVNLLPNGDLQTNSILSKYGLHKLYARSPQGGDSNDLKKVNEWLESVFYDRQSASDASATFLGMSPEKLSASISSLTAITALGLNIPQAANQWLMDNTVSIQEGISGGYFTAKNLGKAKMHMGTLGGNLAETASGKLTKGNKIGAFMELTNALQEGSQAFNNLTGSAAKKAASVSTLTFAQKAADIQLMGQKVLAMAFEMEGQLKDKDGNVIKNEDGSDANLYDVFIQDSKGRWIIDPRVANFNLAKFSLRVSSMSKTLNQLRGSVDVVAAQRRAGARLLLLFRSYFVPGLRRRFGFGDGAHIDVESGELTNGYYNTMINAMSNLIQTRDLKKTFGDLSESEKKNLMRAGVEMAVSTIALMLANTIKGMFDDDDEKNPYWASFTVYQALRLRSELVAFRNIEEFIRLAESPTATIRPVKNAWELAVSAKNLGMYNLGWPVDEKEIYYQRKSGPYEKGDLKVVKELTDILPGFSGVSKTNNPENLAKFYEK